MKRLRPQTIKGIKVKGKIIEVGKNEFTFRQIRKNEELQENAKRSYTVRNETKGNQGEKNYYLDPAITNIEVILVYLNKESSEGLYKDPERNKPYEILSNHNPHKTLYRYRTTTPKEKIYNELEKVAIEEGLRE